MCFKLKTREFQKSIWPWLGGFRYLGSCILDDKGRAFEELAHTNGYTIEIMKQWIFGVFSAMVECSVKLMPLCRFFSRRGANLCWTTPWKFLSQHRVDSIVPATSSDVWRAKCKPYSLPDDANRMLFVWFMTPGKIPRDPQHWLWKFHQVRHPHSAPCHWRSWHHWGRCSWGKNEWRSLLSGWVFSGLGWILAILGWDCMVLEGISWKDGWKARFVPAKWDSNHLLCQSCHLPGTGGCS